MIINMLAAICDDNAEHRKRLENFMERLKNTYSGLEWRSFGNAEEVWKCYQRKGNIFDILITDIEMDEMSGIKLANKVRERDRVVVIIYVTSYSHYAKQCFEAQPLSFWEKPVSFDEVQKDFKRAKNRLEELHKCISFYENRERIVLYYDNIIYFEAWGKKTIVHTADKEYATNQSLAELCRTIDGEQFARVSQTFVVNYAYVENYSKGVLRLYKTLGEIKVSRTYSRDWEIGLLKFKARRAWE